MPTTEGYNGAYTGKQIDAAIAKAQKAVTLEGGGITSMDESLGDAPYVIEFKEDDPSDIMANEVGFVPGATGMESTNVQEAVTELFQSVSDGKSAVAAAITDKGVTTAADATFQQMATNIGQIQSGATLITTRDPEEMVDLFIQVRDGQKSVAVLSMLDVSSGDPIVGLSIAAVGQNSLYTRVAGDLLFADYETLYALFGYQPVNFDFSMDLINYSASLILTDAAGGIFVWDTNGGTLTDDFGGALAIEACVI